MPIYRANGNRYNIPDDKIQDFERRYPESKVEMYDGEGKKYAIPLSKRNKFQQRYEKWSYVTEETKKESPNTFVSNQNPQNTIISEDELENSIADYEESLGHGKYGAANTPLFQKVRQAATSAEQIADGIIDKNWISKSPSPSVSQGNIGGVPEGRGVSNSSSNRTPVSDAYKSQFDKTIEDRFADARTRLEKDVVFQFENMLDKLEEDIDQGIKSTSVKTPSLRESLVSGLDAAINDNALHELGRIKKSSGLSEEQLLTRKYISEARDVIEMYKRKDGNWLANFADAFARSFDSGILTLGATDAIDMGRVLAIANKIGDKGEGFEKLTREEQQLMAAFSLLDQIQGSLQLDSWQNIGQGTMQSLPFLVQFALTGGVGAAASAATKAAAKTAVKKIIGKSASKAVSRIAANAGKNAAGRVAVKAASKLGNAAIDGLVGGTVMAITSGVAHTVEDVMNRMVGNHDIRLDSINDPGGELKTIYTHHGVEDRESLGLAFLKGFAANLIENGTEYMGNYMGLNLGKLLSRFKGGRQLLTKPLIGKTTRFARQVGKLTGFNGFIPEVAEEELGMLLNAATVGDVEWKDIKDPEQQFQTVMAVGIMSLGFQVANSIGVGLTYNKYRKAKKRYESKDLGEGLSVDDIIHGLDNVPLDRRADYVMAMVNTHDLGKGDAKDLQDFVMARTGYEFILGKIESDAEEAGDKAAEAEMRLINKEMGGKVTVTLLDGREAILTVGNVSLEPNAAGEYTSTTQSGSLIAVPVGIGDTPIMVSPKDIRSVSIMSTEDAVGQARAMAEDITKTNMASQIENEADEVESDEQSRTPSSTMSGGEIGELSPRDEGVEKQPLYRKSELEIGDVVTFKDYSDLDNPGVERTLKIIGIDDSGVDVEDVVDGVPLPLSIKPEQITHVKGKEKKLPVTIEENRQTAPQSEITDTSEYTRFVEDGTVEDSTVLRIANKIANGEQLTREEEAMRQEVSQRVEDKLREIQQNVEGKEETDRWAKYRKSNGEVDEKKMPLREQFEYGEEIAGVKAMIEVAKAGTKKTQSEIARLEKEIEREISPVKRVNKEKQLKSLNERLGTYQQYLEDNNSDLQSLKATPANIVDRIAALGDIKSLRDYILRLVATGNIKFKWGDTDSSKGLASHLGINDSPGERRKRISLLSNSGYTPEQLAHNIWEQQDVQNSDLPFKGYETDEILDEILDVMSSVYSPSQALELAEQIANEDLRKQEMASQDYESHGLEQSSIEQIELEPLPDDLAPRNNIAFRRNESGETPSGQTQINERESNSDKENSLSSQEEKQIDSQDEILQSIPQRERGTEAQKDRGMEEAERAIRRSQSSGTNETQFGGSQSALSRQEIEARAAEEYDPVGEGPFGEIYIQFKGKPREAIDFLMKKKSGEAIGALYHKDVGDIDLVWGKEGTGHSDGFGLAKLVKYHPEVLDNLQDILNDMQVTTRNSNRINLESTTHKATIRLEWDGNKKNWLLTAFEKENPASTKTTDTDTTSLRGGTALSQTGFSAGKDNTGASNKQEKPRLSTQKTLQERRQEIQEYIEREAGKLNIPVRIVGDVSQISPSEKNYTKKLTSQGWYDQTTGEIVIVTPNHGSIRDAQRTLLHETVAHYGLPAMLGRENFDKLCDQVWDSMTDRERAVFGAYIDEKIDDKSYNSLTEEEKERYAANDFSGKRAAADEYLAHFAEEGITNPSLWSKIKRFIKEAFRKIGIDLSLTDSDIAYLLWKSKNRITDRDSTTDIIRKSAADTRIKENIGSTRFRINTPVEQRGDLVAIHNISEDKLKEAIGLGGFPMPSITITKPEVGHSTFGDISLVFGKETINPTDRRNKVYGEDAWTPTFPTVGYKLNEDKTSDIYRRANKTGNLPLFNPSYFHSDNYESYINGIGSDSLVNHFKDSYGAKQLYLAETGNAVEKFEEHEVEKYSTERIGFLEQMLKEIGIERLKKESYAVLENEIKQIFGKYYNVDLDKLQPFRVKIRIDNAIKQAVDYAENGNNKTESDVEATKKKIDERIDQKKFEEWLRNLFDGVVEKKGIRNETDLFTPMGNRRKRESLYDEITLDNVVKAMKKQSAKGGQGLFGGSIFGAAQSEFKNIGEIREAARERIRELSNEEIEGRRNEITDRLSQIDIPMRDKGIGDAFDMIENITDSVRHSHTAKGIYNYLHDIYPAMTMDIANEIADIVKDIQQMSARYFEAKPHRAVGFDEIKFAVVPDNTDSGLLNQLQNMKIPVEIYEKGNNEQRKQILNETADKYDTRFRMVEAYTPEEQDIIERALKNGTYMKAPNGADTNLTPKQWVQVRTNAFKDWFGDWENSPEKASKVVDENGEPKVVFHGTPLRRDRITPNRGWQKDGITYISQEAPFYTFRGGEYSGMIFTSVDAEKARSIAEKRAMSIPDDMDGTEQWTEEGYVYDLFVDVKNPFVPQRDADIILSSLGDEIPTLSFYGGQGDTVSVETAKEILNSGNNWLVTETPQFVAEIKKLGYDGLIGTDEGVDYIACFNPNQLKDAYDNTGVFSTGNDDIRFRIREEEPPKNTGIGYKVFVLKNGKLYPPMVANPNGEDTPVGVWLDADAAPIVSQSKTGRNQVKAGGKGTQGGSGKLAYRPGWHLGEIPYAIQFNRKNPITGEKELFPANFVWAEVEYAKDVDYQQEAYNYGLNANGNYQHSLAGLPYLPTNGSYKYRTNPNPETDPWIITGSIRVKRLLTPSEVDEIVSEAGREIQQREEGAVTDVEINSLNKKLNLDSIRFRTIVVNPRYGSKIETVRTNHTSVYKAVDKYLRENFDEKDYTTHTAKTGSRYLELNIGNDTLKVRFANHTPRMEASDNMDTIGNGKEIAFFPGGDIGVEIDISLSGDRSKEIIDLIKGMEEYSSSEVKKEVSRLIDGAKTDPFPDVASPQLIEELSHYIGTEMAGTLDTQIAEYYKYHVNENVYKQESKSRDSKLKQNKYVLEQYKTIFRDFVQESPKLIKAVGGGYWYNGATGSIRIVPPFPIDYGLLSDKLMSSHFIPIPGINKKEGKRQIVQEYVDEWSRRLTDSGIFLSEEYVSEGAKITEAQQEIDNIREQYNFWVKAKLNTVTSADIRYRTAEDMEEVNQRFNEELAELTEENAQSKILYLGRPNEILSSVGIPDKELKLYGNKLIAKSKKHGFDVNEVKDLPQFMDTPIMVFSGSQPNSFAILTELPLNGKNVLVSIGVGKGVDVDFNIVTSVYGKKDDSIIRWINSGNLLYVDREKALNYLRIPAPIAGAQDNSELLSATNIVENFENPKLAGENSDGTMNTRFRREAPDVSSYIKISMDRKGIVDLSQLSPNQSQRIRKSAPAAYGAEISGDIASFPDYQEAENCLTYIFDNNDIISDDIRNSIDNGTLPQDIAIIFDAALRRGMVRRVWIDRYQPLEALQKLISSTLGKEISEKENAWEYTGFMDSRIKAEADEYNADYYLPLLELYEKIIHGKNGVDEDTLVDYMLIKHGIERNQVMRREALEEWEESHKGVEDYDKKRTSYIQELSTRDYSGYFDRFKQEYARNYNTAEDFISEVESLLGENTVINLWDKIKKATNKTLDISVKSGLVSKEDADTYKKRFQFYVPLRGFSEETMDQMYDSNIRINPGSTVNKQAKGRTSRADNPLVSIMAMANTEIARANKNKMKQRLLTLLAGKDVRNKFGYSYEVEYKDGKEKILKYKPKQSDEIKKITTISNIYQIIPKYEILALDTNGNPILDEHGNKTWVETDEVPSAEQLESGMARFSKAYPSNRGTVHKTPSQMEESTVDVFVAGKKVSILFTNPLVSNSINGRLNLDKNVPRKIETPDQWYNIPGWLTYGARHLNRLGARTTRALSQFYTTYSPAFFLFSNFARDFSGAFAYNSAEKSIAEARQIAALAPDSFAAMRRYIRGESKNKRYTIEEIESFLDRMGRKGKISKSDYDIAAYLFVSRGGETGYISANTVEDYRKSIDNAVKYGTVDMNKQAKAIKKGYMAGVKAIQDTARLMESVTRLNQFVAALMEGKTIDAAITDAKNVSTNFNRRGSHEGIQWIFDNYAFLNASLQGTDRLYRGIKKYKKGFAKVIGTIISIGFLDSLLCAIFSGDDDRWGDAYHALPETKRYNNLVIPVGEGKFIFIPLAQSLRGFHAWGIMLADIITGYHKKHPLISDPVKPLDFFAVIGQDIVPITYGSWTNAAPTWAQPIAHIAFNENFMGRPLYKETPWNENLPEFRKAYGSTPKGLVKWSEFVNEMTGGNYAEKGWLEQIPVLEKLNSPAVLQQLYLGYVPGLFRVLGQAYNAVDALVTKTKGRPTDFDLSDVPIIGAAVGEANDRIPKAKLRSKWYEFANKARDSKRADSELLKELFIDEFIENTRDSDKVLNKSVYDGLNVHIRNLMKLEGMAETWEDDLVSGDLPADEAIRTSAEIASLRNTIDNTLYDIINELKIAQ